MNTANLIPISYVKKITPLVVGDLLVSDHLGELVGSQDESIEMWNSNRSDDLWCLVSFADRPNTGTQPVDIGDLLVDVEYYYSHKDFGTKTLTVDELVWGSVTTYKSWKPNHAAMLKQWQAEQATVQAHHIALQVEELGDVPAFDTVSHDDRWVDCYTSIPISEVINGVHIDDDGDLAVGSEKVGIASQGFADTLTVGMKFMGMDEVHVFTECVAIAILETSKGDSIVTYEYNDGCSVASCWLINEWVKPIQTAEQKLRDKFIHFYQKGINDELCIDDAADELLSEFTITLKG
jgi:hypothetical protein